MNLRSAAAPALALAAALALAGCTGSQPGYGMPGMDHGDGNGSQVQSDVNAADLMFVRMMIPHHEQAVEMSDLLLAKEGIDEDVRALAEQIKAAQQPEIDQMEAWLDEWGADMPGMGDMDGMGHGDGMMSEADMEELEAATGAEASRLFLEQMIEHHEGAIEMAEEQIDDGENAEVIALSRSIVESQTAEIATMEELLTQL